MALAILLHKEKDEIDVHLNLFDQLHFKDYIITNILFLFLFAPVTVGKVEVNAGVVLHVALAEHISLLELVEDAEQVAHLQDVAKQLDKGFFGFLTQGQFARLQAIH